MSQLEGRMFHPTEVAAQLRECVAKVQARHALSEVVAKLHALADMFGRMNNGATHTYIFGAKPVHIGHGVLPEGENIPPVPFVHVYEVGPDGKPNGDSFAVCFYKGEDMERFINEGIMARLTCKFPGVPH